MPIHEADPWRLQYFAHVETDVDITTEDSDAWQWYPAHRWVYDKLAVAHSQGLEAGPHGTKPPRFPVFSKPIVNLKGMGIGSRLLRSQADYDAHAAPGHFWMRLLEGRHVSSDLAVIDGEPRWWRHVTGKPAGEGTFDYWTIHAEPEPEIQARCGAWVRKHLAGYAGMLNLETVGGTIIEVHLRFADQWPDFMGPAGSMRWLGFTRQASGISPTEIAAAAIASCCLGLMARATTVRLRSSSKAVKREPGISSVQITFHEDLAPELHAMPPGGFRLAVVNGFDLAAALSARTRLEDHFVERRMCLVRYADDRKATVGRDHVEAALQLPKLGRLARACARARQCVAVP